VSYYKVSSGVFSQFLVGQMVGLSVGKRLLLRNQEKSKGQIYKPMPTHAGGDHKLSAAAFGAPIPNFGGGGVLKHPAAAAARPARRRVLVQGRVECSGGVVDPERLAERVHRKIGKTVEFKRKAPSPERRDPNTV